MRRVTLQSVADALCLHITTVSKALQGHPHIAAATRTPAVGIFGMTRPEYRFSKNFRKNFVATGVECAGCEHRKPRLHWVTGCPHDIQCMKQISVEEVLRACLAKLELPVK